MAPVSVSNERLEVRLGEFAIASGIMTEAGNWLAGLGQPLWGPDEVTEQALGARPADGLVLVGYIAGEPVVTTLLDWQDDLFWPGKSDSGFIHRLAIRRAYAGRGHAETLLGEAAAICRTSAKPYLRLDCVASRDKLRSFYERCGFRFVGTAVREPHFHQALYELATD